MKINGFIIGIAVILLANSVISVSFKNAAESLTTFELCFSTSRTGTQTERANLKQFAKRGNLLLLQEISRYWNC